MSELKWWHPSEVWDWYRDMNRHKDGGCGFVSAPDHIKIKTDLTSKVSELEKDLTMVRASQERQRQLNDAQSLKIQSAREVIEMAKTNFHYAWDFLCSKSFDTQAKVMLKSYERAREWMKGNA